MPTIQIYNNDFDDGVVDLTTEPGLCVISEESSHQGSGVTGSMCLKTSATGSELYNSFSWNSAPISLLNLNNYVPSDVSDGFFKIDTLNPFYYDYLIQSMSYGLAIDSGDRQNGWLFELYVAPACWGESYWGGCGPNCGTPQVRIYELTSGTASLKYNTEISYSSPRPGILLRTNINTAASSSTLGQNEISFWYQMWDYTSSMSPVTESSMYHAYTGNLSASLGFPAVRVIPSYFRSHLNSNSTGNTTFCWTDYINIDVTVESVLLECSAPKIGNDFTINVFECLSRQYTNRFGSSLKTVPMYLGCPGFNPRLRPQLPPSSSL